MNNDKIQWHSGFAAAILQITVYERHFDSQFWTVCRRGGEIFIKPDRSLIPDSDLSAA